VRQILDLLEVLGAVASEGVWLWRELLETNRVDAREAPRGSSPSVANSLNSCQHE
jgi:hypothetical protein